MASSWRLLRLVIMLVSLAHCQAGAVANTNGKEDCIKEVGKLMGGSEIGAEVKNYIQQARRLYEMPIKTGNHERFKSTEGCKRILDQWRDFEIESDCEKSSRHGLMSAAFMRGVIGQSQSAKDMVEAWFVCTHGDETPWAMADLGILEEYKQTGHNDRR